MKDENKSNHVELFLNDEEATNGLAKQLARYVWQGSGADVPAPPASGRIHLRGDLGA